MHLCTFLARSSAPLSSAISRLAQSYPGHPLLFALSTNLPSKDLSQLVTQLNSFSGQTAGCLSAPVSLDSNRSLVSCSLAVLDPKRTTTFRSIIPGIPTPQVGRWHAFRNKNDVPTREESFSWDEIWNGNAKNIHLPEQLQVLNEAEVGGVVFFSDRSPQGFLKSLAAFPHATKLGLIASSTPFITGRPVTLFHNGSIYDNGAVGVALSRESTERATASTRFSGATPLSAPMVITRSEGNMVVSLQGQNPTQILLNHLQESGLHLDSRGQFKEGDLVLLATLDNGKVTRMYKITAGDPSREGLSLDSESAPSVGVTVQFFYWSLTEHGPSGLRAEKCVPETRTLQFLAAPDMPLISNQNDPSLKDHSPEHLDAELTGNFVGASENGFVMGHNGEDSWMCSIPGGTGILQWPC